MGVKVFLSAVALLAVIELASSQPGITLYMKKDFKGWGKQAIQYLNLNEKACFNLYDYRWHQGKILRTMNDIVTSFKLHNTNCVRMCIDKDCVAKNVGDCTQFGSDFSELDKNYNDQISSVQKCPASG